MARFKTLSEEEEREGDYAEVVRMVRNLVHAGKYRKEHFRKRVTKKYLEQQFEVVEACREWLSDHNAKSLLAQMKEEEAAKAGGK